MRTRRISTVRCELGRASAIATVVGIVMLTACRSAHPIPKKPVVPIEGCWEAERSPISDDSVAGTVDCFFDDRVTIRSPDGREDSRLVRWTDRVATQWNGVLLGPEQTPATIHVETDGMRARVFSEGQLLVLGRPPGFDARAEAEVAENVPSPVELCARARQCADAADQTVGGTTFSRETAGLEATAACSESIRGIQIVIARLGRTLPVACR